MSVILNVEIAGERFLFHEELVEDASQAPNVDFIVVSRGSEFRGTVKVVVLCRFGPFQSYVCKRESESADFPSFIRFEVENCLSVMSKSLPFPGLKALWT